MSETRELIAAALLPKCMWFGLGETQRLMAGEFADAVLAALSQAGLVIVPKEPTEVMTEAGDSCVPGLRDRGIICADVADDVYRAMIDAAGKP